MAPTAPAATGAASPAAPAVVKGEGKAAARSAGLGLPALPPLPGLGLAAQGQTRAASFCKRLARNVVAMAAGEPPAPLAANEELTEFVNALKQEWDRIEDKYAVTTLAVAATLGMWSAGGVVSAIDRLPVVPGLMEAVGIGYTGWFAYRNLLFKPDRVAFFAKVREVYEDIISG
ncbi:Protein CURVATURE THYLAKOID 1B, chloroplastic [Dichanthelium oligosanthes]|uniref:Protein CURVATURE THYLAKOID 1B, chloroplastic n=1 Tax=Dichanthelium oligosanthes TaxID=888268 RepID=A0A1E5VBB8_9POAL|nr:Protein CURVATURE THYLAKOID 1B, chloroplastic [Dichanthelium oligosanthes]